MDLLLPEESLHRSRLALVTYWDRYRALFPEHRVFGILSRDELKFTVPIKLHGDEGRSALTVDKFHSCHLAVCWVDVPLALGD